MERHSYKPRKDHDGIKQTPQKLEEARKNFPRNATGRVPADITNKQVAAEYLQNEAGQRLTGGLPREFTS